MIRTLKQNDIKGLNKLPPVDWKFDYEDFLHNFMEDDFFYAFAMVKDNEIIGTGNVFLENKIGWLANIIVAEEFRGNGFGSMLTKFLVDFLNDKGCETQLLIATELGEPVYQKIGFNKITEYHCFDSEEDYDFEYSNSIRELNIADLDSVYKLDYEANAENREHLLIRYHKSGFGYFTPDNEMLGVYLPNFGRGLVLSKDKKAGIELLKLKHSKKGKRTLLPIDNKDGIKFLEKSGLKKGNKCSRMILGKKNNWTPSYIYSYGSGYCG